jgi:hypothetical protein
VALVAAVAGAICLAVAGPASEDEERLVPPASIPKLPAVAVSAKGFAPPGWNVERSLSGDLDGDGRADLVAVLKGADKKCRVRVGPDRAPLDSNPRLLLVAFARGSGYALQLANPAAIARQEDPYMDDPLANGGLAIRDGVVRLRLGSWRSAGSWGTYTNAFAFRWDGRAFRLIGFDRDHLQRNSGETEQLSVNFLTGKAKITRGSSADETPDRVRWTSLPRQVVPTLETLDDGLAYQPRLPPDAEEGS